QAIFIPNPANNDAVYTVYGENEDGTCTGEYSFQIQVFQEPEISVQIPTVCVGESSVLEATIEGGSQDFEYEWIPTTGLNNPNSSSTEINIQEPTTYTLIVTDLVQGCEILQEVLVPVSTSLSLIPELQICAGGETILSIEGIEEGANIFWTDDTGSSYEGNNIEVSPSVTTNYYPTSDEFCFSNDAITVEVIDLNIQINASKTTICKGETIELTATGAASFEWTPVEGVSDQSNAFQVVAPEQTTTYLVSGYSANGFCIEPAEITIEVLSAEVLSPLTTQICGEGGTVQLGVNAGEMATYGWSPAIGLSATNTSMVTANPSETTLYNLQTTNAEGCEENFNFLVEVNEQPDITISPSELEVCQFLSQTFTLSGGVEYIFSAEEGQNFDIAYYTPNTVNITATTSLNLTIEGTDENGCKNTTQANIEVTDPVLAISQGGLICVGESIELFADGGEGATYSWTPAGSLNDPTVANPIANPSEGTVYTVNITDASGCSGSGTIYVPVSFPVEGALVSSEGNQVCEGTTTVLSFENNSDNPHDYFWYDESGSLIEENTTGLLTVVVNTTETYSVVIVNEDNCQETKEITLTLNEPNIEAQDGAACVGGETIMTVSGAGIDGTYEWQPAEFITCNNPDCSSVTIAAFAEETTVDFTVTGTNAQGCSTTTEANLFVSQSLTLSISPENPTLCMGESLTINAGGASSFIWEGPNISSPNGNSVMIEPIAPGVYTYILNGLAGNCEATSNFEVTVYESPQITVQDVNICNGENALLEANGTTGLTYQWFDANDEEITDLTISPNQTSSYTVLGTNPDGCQSSEVMIVNVSEVDFEVGAASMDICEGETAILTPIGTEIVNYEWSTGVTTIEGESLELSPSTTSTYEVVATNTNGCTSTQQVTIEVHPDPVIELQENFLACADEALLVEATVESENGSLQWTPPMNFDNPNIANPTITSTTTSSYVLIATSEFDCATAATTTIEITDECVFPGDANNDGTVDMFDLFPLGVNFGASDLARNSISNEWRGFGVADWTETQNNGQNLKYVDCNGDGSIGFEDTAAIVQNFDLFQKSGGFVKGSLGDPELRFVPDFGVIGVGEYLQIEVWLGSDENPATDLYAIAFETTFDVNLIDPNSISMDYSGSDLGTHNVDLLAVDLVNETTGRVNVSMSRTASPGANGSVYLLTIRMRTWENLDDINNLTFNISDFGATDSTEEPVLANLDDIPVITINPDIVDIEGIHTLSKPYDLYPTFTQDGFQLNYTLQKNPAVEVNLFALSGQKIGSLLKESQALGNHQEAVDLTQWNLTAGVYIVELQLDGEVYREKIIVF
ncbi:MAG: T9SS type A sorting domain-containing protein, partial [Chitinophagales bacterium]